MNDPNNKTDDNSWRTPSFRQGVVARIDESIQKSGMPTTCNSVEMENHVFQKAKSKEEYMGMVARLIFHVRDMKKTGTGNPQGTPGLPGTPGTGGPNINQGGGNPAQGTGGSGGPGMSADPINALQNLASQGSRNNQMMNNMGQPGQMQVSQPNMMGPGNGMQQMQNQMGQQVGMGGPQQNQAITATNLLQTLNQRPQLGNMQQMQNKMGGGMGMMPNQGPMGANTMGPNQMGGSMINQVPNQMNQGNMMMNQGNMGMSNPIGNQMSGGGNMPNQMMQNTMNPNMANQMMGSNQMQGQMGNMASNQMNMMHMQQRKPADNMTGMIGGNTGGFPPGGPRVGTPGQFLRQSPSPSAPSPAGMGGPSPASMNVMGGPMSSPMSVGSSGMGVGGGGPVGGVASPALAPSPSSHHSSQQHSQQHMQHQQRSIGMAPSPSSSLNTPLGAGAAPSPLGGGGAISNDEHAYREKVRQLSKYIEPLRRMISRMVSDGENVEKLTKMKNFLDILSHPSKRMPLETLLKCEVVLEKLDFKRGEGLSLHSQNPLHLHGIKDYQMFNPLLEVVSNTLQSPLANHTLKRTFGPCVEALCGPEIRHMPPPLKKQKIEDPEPDIPDVLQGEIARLDSRFKVSLEGLQVGTSTGAIRLIAQLEDSRLPCVPPVSVSIPREYPSIPPTCLPPTNHYDATPFLKRVGAALDARLATLPRKFSLSQLLDTWEMSVRQACNPQNQTSPHPTTSVLLGA